MKSMKSALTIDAVRNALDYDPATGIFVWKVVASNRIKIGSRAGVIAANGRRYISVAGEKHTAHRLAWFYLHGEWPVGDVKQANGDYDDCREANLVHQTRQETASNRNVNASSKSGHAGVTWSETRGKWQVHITRNYKQVFVGLFTELADAVAARLEASANNVSGVSTADAERSAHKVARRRRQRAAWERLVSLNEPLGWASIDEFCKDIGGIPETKVAIVAIDAKFPIGPGNFRWAVPVDQKHDFQSRDGRIAYNKAHRAANPSLYREKELQKKFNIGNTEFDLMLAAQDGVCAICKRPERAVRDGKALSLAVDHDHATMKIRGVLCGACNKAIGKFEDNVEFLENAISYLRKHASSDIPARVPSSLHCGWATGFGEH